MNFKTILLLIVVVIVIIFIVQNTTTVSVSFLFFEATMPRALLLILTLASGIIIGILLPYQFKKHK
ncbi:LapA family protein [candidate division KSB1 bacterium]